ncbi:MAG: MATE family efflux transporter, partial [bacterium]|nr:MATE family efflux transporter [bacterium]
DRITENRDLITTGSVDRGIIHLGVPAAFAALFQAGFLIVDTFWLGRVGPVAIAAASTAGFVMWFAQTLGDGAAMGSGSVLAHAVGSDDSEGAKRASVAGFVIALLGSFMVSAVGLALTGPIFDFMGTAEDVSAAGRSYLLVILCGMPAYFVFVWISAVFRATGDAQTPLRLLALAAAVNVVIDPLLIFGIGPLPPLGVTGAAIATVLSWVVGSGLGWIRLGSLGLRPTLRSLARPPSSEVWQALRIGLPLGIEGALFSLIYVLLTRVTTTFGTPAVAALGIGHKLEMLNYFVCAGMGATATTMVGQNLGAGAFERAQRAAWRTLFLTCLPVGAVTIALVGFPEAAVGVFSGDRAVIAAGVTYVLIVGFCELFMAFEVVLLGAFAGAQWTTMPAVIEVSLTAARVPLAMMLVWYGWGVEGVWVAITVTTIAKGITLAVLFRSRANTFKSLAT